MMIPTKPIGPATETAAPVASEALKNAARWAWRTSMPCVSALSGPRLSRFSGRASQANTAKLLESNPTLMRLRELEVLEKVATAGDLKVVLGEKGLADRIVNLL